MMTELDVVNDALATMGEAPLVAIDEDHPLVAGIRRIFKNQCEAIQSEQWYFNKEIITLVPDADSSFIYVPLDTIRCDPVLSTYHGQVGYTPIVQRGRRLYNTETNAYEMTEPVKCILIRNIPFADLPSTAQRVISLATSLRFQQNYDADPSRTQQLVLDYNIARGVLMAEHTRNIKANFIWKNGLANKLINIGGSTYRPF